jgi:hypothetical protein
MGGRRNYIIKITNLYEEMLTNALPLGKPALNPPFPLHDSPFLLLLLLGCLGTEETMMSLVWYTRPDLFHVHFNAPRAVPFDGGDICRFALQGPESDWKVRLVARLSFPSRQSTHAIHHHVQEPEMFTQQKWFQEQKKLAAEKKQAAKQD